MTGDLERHILLCNVRKPHWPSTLDASLSDSMTLGCSLVVQYLHCSVNCTIS